MRQLLNQAIKLSDNFLCYQLIKSYLNYDFMPLLNLYFIYL